MSFCPYCKEPIDENWSFCRHCNKPLIVNIDHNRSTRSLQEPFSRSEATIEEEYFDIEEIQDEEIDRKIDEIDKSLAQKEKIGESVGLLLLEKSSLYYKKRNISLALRILDMALNNFTEEDDQLNIAICHNEIGLMHEDNGFFDQAIYHFEIAIEMLKKLNDLKKVIQVLNNIANVYYIIRDLEKSYDYYQEALNLSQEEKFVLEEVKSSNNLVDVLFLLNNFDLITKILERNLVFFKQNEEIHGIIVTTIKYGKLYYYLGGNYYDKAYQSLSESLELIDKINSQISVFVKSQLKWEAYLYLGKLNLLWDNDVEAENLLLESLQAIRTFQMNDSINEGLVLEALAELYKVKGEDQKSIDYYNLSSEIYYKFGDDFKYAELKTKVAAIFLEFIEDEKNAISNFESALEIFENMSYTKESADILHKLGDLYNNQGLIDLAISNFERAKDCFLELQDQYNLELIKEKINSLKS